MPKQIQLTSLKMVLGINLITGTGQLSLLSVCHDWRNVNQFLVSVKRRNGDFVMSFL